MTLQPIRSLKNFVLDTVPQDPPIPDFVHRLLHEVRNTRALAPCPESAASGRFLPFIQFSSSQDRALIHTG